MQENDYQETKDVADIYPDFVKMAEAFGIPSRRVVKPSELREAVRCVSGRLGCGLACGSLAAMYE